MIKIKNKYLRVYIGLVLGFSSIGLNAQIQYQSLCLSHIGEQLSMSQQISPFNGTFIWFSSRVNALVKAEAQNGVVSHIGYYLFSDSVSVAIGKDVCRFIERYALLSSLPTLYGAPFSQEMEENKVSFRKGSFRDIIHLNIHNPLIRIEVTYQGKLCYFSIYSETKLKCQLVFPKQWQLITGMVKPELENRLNKVLKSTPAENISQSLNVLEKELMAKSDYWVLKGDSFYTSLLNNTLYFKEWNPDGSKLLFNKRFPIQSIANIMLYSSPVPLKMNIEHHVYGGRIEHSIVNINSWHTIVRQEKCTAYWGVKKIENNNVEGIYVAYNNQYDYAHLMLVSFPIRALNNPETEIQCSLYSYISVNEIISLFDKEY